MTGEVIWNDFFNNATFRAGVSWFSALVSIGFTLLTILQNRKQNHILNAWNEKSLEVSNKTLNLEQEKALSEKQKIRYLKRDNLLSENNPFVKFVAKYKNIPWMLEISEVKPKHWCYSFDSNDKSIHHDSIIMPKFVEFDLQSKKIAMKIANDNWYIVDIEATLDLP